VYDLYQPVEPHQLLGEHRVHGLVVVHRVLVPAGAEAGAVQQRQTAAQVSAQDEGGGSKI
jgi:hypothetical protein